MKEKLTKEIHSFQNLWKGGTTPSKYGWAKAAKISKRSGSHDMYKISEICIDPYVKDVVAWDLGTNGGGWLTRMTNAKSIIATDVLPAHHTEFWKNVPTEILHKVNFFVVKDFTCNNIENESVDLLFSYDVFCHISYSGAEEYLKNIYPKLKYGANCFIMIADQNKYLDQTGRDKLMRSAGFEDWLSFVDSYDGDPVPGTARWSFYGTERFCNLLEKYNFQIVDRDVIGEYDARSPIIHFKK